MTLLELDVPPLEGFLMSKKRSLETMECIKEFADGIVIEYVQQRTEKVKIARTAKVEEMEAAAAAAAAAMRKEIMEAATVEIMEAATVAAVAIRKEIARVAVVGMWRREEVAAVAKRKKIMEAETVAAAAAAAAAAKRKMFLENTGNQPSCVRWCSHVGCSNNVHARGVCRDHGPRCSPVGCGKNVYTRGVCSEHDIVIY